MSREIPYNPMHGAQKHVSEERMREILAKHARKPAGSEPQGEDHAAPLADGSVPGESASGNGVDSAQAVVAVAALDWDRVSEYRLRSKCTTFEIEKHVVGNQVTDDGGNIRNGRWVYQCWRKVQQLWFVKFDPAYNNAELAKAACARHARG